MSAYTHSKLIGIAPKDIIAMLDYDLTLAEKNDPNDTDHAPLTAAHYAGLCEFGGRIGRNITLTARGEKSVLKYFGEHVASFGRMPNTTLASNSGHIWHKLDQPRRAEHHIISIPGHDPTSMLTLTSEIHTLVTKLKSEFADITADMRELCGAVIFQFDKDGHKDGQDIFSRFDAFTRRANELKGALDSEARTNIQFAPKNWMETFDDTTQMRGYIDIIPKGMSKGFTSKILFNEYKNQVENPFLIVGGDSGADYDMMKALAHEVPQARRLFISVGKGLIEHDNAYAQKHGGQKLLDIVFDGNGLTPVNQMHAFLQNVGLEGRRPAFVVDQKTAAAATYVPGSQRTA